MTEGRRPRRGARVAALTAALGTSLAACTSSDPAEADTTEAVGSAGLPAATPTPSSGSAAATGSVELPRPDPPLGPQDAVRTVVVRDDDGDWPGLLADRLAAVGVPMTITADTAVPGSGFAADPPFAEQVASTAVGSTQLVLMVDGQEDTADADALAAAAVDAVEAVERAASDARVVVVGPWSGRSEPAAAALRAAAEDAGADSIDPGSEGWPDRPSPEQVADLLLPALRPTVEALAASGANH